LHQRGYAISLIPASRVNHEDSTEMPHHQADTEDYVRGEMDARAENDPVFFERYFGPPPSLGSIRPARDARSLLRGLVIAALYRPRQAFDLISRACVLLPTALVSLRERSRLLAMLLHLHRFSMICLRLPKNMRWRQFIRAHERIIKAEQMRWVAGHPMPALEIGADNARWPIDAIAPRAISGMHALERQDDVAYRWTCPVFLLRLAVPASGVLTLETRNLRPKINLSDIIVVVDGKLLSSGYLDYDDAGNLKLQIQPSPTFQGETDIVVIASELREPPTENAPGRRLGLPLFSIGFESCPAGDHLSPRP
jgi:hypothetical protein